MLAPKPIPSTPTHCTACGSELPPLRRYAGLCAECVTTYEPAKLEDPSRRKWTIVARYMRRRRDGKPEQRLRVRCECGTERVMSAAEWHDRRSQQCNDCRMQRAGKAVRGILHDTQRIIRRAAKRARGR